MLSRRELRKLGIMIDLLNKRRKHPKATSWKERFRKQRKAKLPKAEDQKAKLPNTKLPKCKTSEIKASETKASEITPLPFRWLLPMNTHIVCLYFSYDDDHDDDQDVMYWLRCVFLSSNSSQARAARYEGSLSFTTCGAGAFTARRRLKKHIVWQTRHHCWNISNQYIS